MNEVTQLNYETWDSGFVDQDIGSTFNSFLNI
jgi:hypothetical protein